MQFPLYALCLGRGRVMISELHHYALEVPDLAVAEGFLQDFGLETGEKDGSLVAMCPGRQQEQVRLVEAPAKRLHHITFTLRPGSADAVRRATDPSGTPVIGFISSTPRGFHHASFEVPSIDAIAVGADRMRAKGHQAGWGLGRHTIGSNFFHYNPDPWGSWIEWFSDIDQIDDCWVAGDWDVPPHLWGTPPPGTFLANSEPAS